MYVPKSHAALSYSTSQRMEKSKLLYADLLKYTMKQTNLAKGALVICRLFLTDYFFVDMHKVGQQVTSTLKEIAVLHPGDVGMKEKKCHEKNLANNITCTSHKLIKILGLLLLDLSAYSAELDDSMRVWVFSTNSLVTF